MCVCVCVCVCVRACVCVCVCVCVCECVCVWGGGCGGWLTRAGTACLTGNPLIVSSLPITSSCPISIQACNWSPSSSALSIPVRRLWARESEGTSTMTLSTCTFNHCISTHCWWMRGLYCAGCAASLTPLRPESLVSERGFPSPLAWLHRHSTVKERHTHTPCICPYRAFSVFPQREGPLGHPSECHWDLLSQHLH